MPEKNAREYVQETSGHLEHARQCLEHALSSVEKPYNRSKIEQSLHAVEDAISQTTFTESSYIESEK
ncbi:MAG: hypothetical protein ACRCWQ_04690 [Bacilli bacterium]